jgi:MOSC domain-containing protein YiiM
MGQIEQIFIKRAKGGPMDPTERATLKAGRGIVGNANQGGVRQVTLLARERWDGLMSKLGAGLGASTRRANVVLSGIDLENTRGRFLRVGQCRLLVHGETKPCEQMEDALPGLQAAMRDRWAGGVFAEVVEGGDIAVGDSVSWDNS